MVMAWKCAYHLCPSTTGLQSMVILGVNPLKKATNHGTLQSSARMIARARLPPTSTPQTDQNP